MKITIEGETTVVINIDNEQYDNEDEYENDLSGLRSALEAMKQSYYCTWQDRHIRNGGRGAYKIRRLFREAEKIGLL